jgi:hypothetical protein
LPIPVINNSAYESCVANGDDPTGRFKTIVDGLNAYDPARSGDSISYVFSILKSVDYMLPLPTQPQWSVIFDIPASRLYLSTAKNGNVRYFDMKSFDYSCLTDVDVLDINGEGSGDVRSKFVPYTTALNRAFVEEVYGVYASYGVTTPQETLDEIIAFPDTTICMDGDKPSSQDGGTGDAKAGSSDAAWVVDGASTGAGGGDSGEPVGGRRTMDAGSATGGAAGSTLATGGSTANGGGSSGCQIGREGHGLAAMALSLLGLVIGRRTRRSHRASRRIV